MKRTLIVALLAALLFTPPMARAQDPAFVGMLALAVEDNVALALGLSDDVKKQLNELIAKREDEILKAGIDQLPEDEQKAKLAAFVAESEKQGLALLSKDQQTRLIQIRIARGGLSTLADADIAEKVGLDEKQRSNIGKMLSSLKTKLASGTEQERRTAKLDMERGLALVLKPGQRAAWEKLAGLGGGGEAQPAEAVAKVDGEDEGTAAEDEKPADDKDDKAADERPAEEKPAARPEDKKPGSVRASGRKPDDKKPELSKPQPPKNIDDVRLRINFNYAPWKDVLEWLAKEADLSLVGDTMPPGTCNYRDSRAYTVAQTIDLLNGLLQLKGFTLVRRERMLFVWDMEKDGGPPSHIAPLVTPAQLDKRGEFELLTCLFPLNKLSAEQVESDVRKLVGPGGSMSVLTNLKQLSVTETGGKLRAIRDIIKQAEDQSKDAGDFAVIKLTHRTTDEIMGPARQLLSIPEGMTATPDGSLRIAVRVNGFIIQGKAEAIERFKSLVKELDVDDGDVESAPVEQAQVVVYPITTANPDAVLQVLQTVMAGQPNVRLAKDSSTGSIIAHGTPTQHATIKALIDEMQQDKRNFTVIRLKKLDPEEVVAELNKLFGIVEGQNNTSQPKLVANATMNHISVFGSKQQIEQIKAAIIEMGETPANSDPTATLRSYQRSIPLSGRQLESALRQFEAVAPVYFDNNIRVVRAPSSAEADEIPSRIPVPKEWQKKPSKPAAGANTTSDSSRDGRGEDEDRYRGWGGRGWGGRGFDFRGGFPGGDFRGGDERRREGDGERSEDRRSQIARPTQYYYVAWQDPDAVEQNQKDGAEQASEQPAADAVKTPAASSGAAVPKQKTTPGAEIVITVTPNGIILSSEDLDALDKAEEMLASQLTDTQGKEYTVFYLRYARADVAADLLSQAMGGGSGDDGGGGSILGDMAGSMFGGGMGGIMSAMMGGGGGSSVVSSGPVLMIPDNRLNAIVAQGKPGDLDLAESLLKIIDQPRSQIEVETTARPKLIPVYHTTAAAMAETIKQVYANRMVAPAGQQQQISPQQLMQALAGGRGGRGGRGGGGGGNDRKSEEQKMTIGIDEKTNSLIVSAPPSLYEEIKEMVEYLDVASSQKEEFVTTIKTATNPTMLEQQLTSILGEDVSITRVGGTTASTTSRSNTQRNNNTNRTGNNQNRNQRPQGQPQFNPQQFQGFQGFPTGFQGGGGGGGNRGGGGGNRGGGGGNRGGGGR